MILISSVTSAQENLIEQNKVLELFFLSTKSYQNPYADIEMDVRFVHHSGDEYVVPAFWAGDKLWKVRFSSFQTGEFTYETICSDLKNKGLHRQKGNVRVIPYTGSNPLYQHGPIKINEQKHITHADNTPFLWLADSWWHGMTSRFTWPADFQQLTLDRKEKGFSVIQFAAGYPCDIMEFDSRGGNEAGFPTSQDYARINPAYFDLVDLRIQHLVEQGLVPNILGTWGYYLPWFGLENMKNYWRYIIARYGAYPVSWTVAGEATLIYYLTPLDKREETRQFQRDGWSEIASFIKETDPFQRILTAHPGPSSGNFQPITDMSLLDMVMVQPGHAGWESLPNAMDHLNTAVKKFPGKPVMQGEVCFEGMHGGGSDAKLQRLLFWMNMLSGAAGHCYGVDGIWQFNTEEELFGASPGGHAWGNTPWEEAYQWKGSYYVGLGRKILEQYKWQEFEMHPDWIEPAANSENLNHGYAAGIPGNIKLIYFPRGVMPWGQKYRVLQLDTATVYTACFIDPMTGDKYPIEAPITGTNEWTIPAAPILQDWLLEIRKVEKFPKTTFQEPVNPDASPEARNLLRYLYSIQGKYTLSGQHNYPGTISQYSDEAFQLTGKYPAVWGQDFGFTATGKDGIDSRPAMIKEAIRKYEQGFIITLMWHAVRPIDDEPNGWKESVQNKLTEEQWRELVTPGTELHNRWLAQIDTVAGYLKILRDHEVPVLWRPYHEMNGKWFWWGGWEGKEGYQKLWRNMYDRFVNHHQLNNLIWVWNANALVNEWIGDYKVYFPGLDVVDILATDVYGGRYDLVNHTRLLELAEGKPITIGECGKLPTPEILKEQPYWTWFMCWAGHLTKDNNPEEILNIYRDKRVLHRKDVIGEIPME